MTSQEVNIQQTRIEQWNKLNALQNDIFAAIKQLTENRPDGPCEQNPYTGNTRESRQVIWMHIGFTKTRGGANAVEDHLSNLNLEAYDLGRALEGMLREKLKKVQAEMDKL